MEATVGRSLAKTRLRRRQETRQTLATHARPHTGEAREQLTIRDGRTDGEKRVLTRLGNGGNDVAPFDASFENYGNARNSNDIIVRDTKQRISFVQCNAY